LNRQSEEDVKHILGFAYRHYELLKLFMPESAGTLPEYTLTQLQDLTSKDIGYLSRLTENLKKVKLLESYEKPREGGGRPYKVLRLSELGVKLLRSIEEAVKPKEYVKVEVDPWKIEQCLEMMDDPTWSMDLRYKFAYRLFEIVRKEPVQAVNKSAKLKRCFEEWIANPPIGDKIAERKRATISISFGRLLMDKSTRSWALSQYPKIKRMLDQREPEIQLLGISLLEDLCVDPNYRMEVSVFLMEKLLAKPLKELKEGKIAREMLVHLGAVIAGLTKDEKKTLLSKLKAEATQRREAKEKVEYMLDQLMTSFFG